MSVTKETTVWCDGEGCGCFQQEAYNADLVRRDLKRRGWTRDGRKDYCPYCTKKRSKCDDKPKESTR